ncbi:MAG: diguanylate cyclase [Micavibrio sp.]
MQILVIDRDPMFSSLLAKKMRLEGHDVIESAVRHDGIEQIGTTKVDAVYFDPSPLTDPKSILLQIRRMVHTYPYLVLMGHDLTAMDGIKAGCNDALSKPLDPEALHVSLGNAERMVALVQRLGDTGYDFPSAGGVIAKSAFNQLFISAMDRVSRYEETSRVLFIGVANYEDLQFDEGKYAADLAVSKLARNLTRLRRQSDILGQTGHNEYALLLQRPQSGNEALDAARRFAVAIGQWHDVGEGSVADVVISLSLIDLPGGALEFHHEGRIAGRALKAAGV